MNAELHIIVHGLIMAWDVWFQECHCEPNSLVALQLLDQQDIGLHPYVSIVNMINNLKLLDCNITFKHIGW